MCGEKLLRSLLHSVAELLVVSLTTPLQLLHTAVGLNGNDYTVIDFVSVEWRATHHMDVIV